MVIGIDVGISTTKIVGIDNGKIISPTRIKANDPMTSLYGALGKFLFDNAIALSDIEHVMLTGVGAEYVNGGIYGLPTTKVSEFVADVVGAKFVSRLERMIVASMGTGTTLVQVDGNEIHHLGGLGMGGGTLSGLSKLLLGTSDIEHVISLAEKGDISKVNLLIGDISAHPLPGLPMDATASLFGKVKDNAEKSDVAVGLILMVLQTIGSATYLSSLKSGIKDYVMIGNLTKLPQARVIFDSIESLYGVRYIIPEYSDFCTAIGTALSFYDKNFTPAAK